MARLLYVYLGIFLVFLKRFSKHTLRNFGELLKRTGRRLVLLGEDEIPHWGLELLRRCYAEQPDAEFHVGDEVYRGPVYAAFLNSSGELVFRMNWMAKLISGN